MEFGTYTAPDGPKIRYAISVVPNGVPMVLVNGRGEFIEKYAESIASFNTLGFTVFTFDWRGQGLSGRLLSNPQKGHIASFDDYLADFHGLMQSVVLPKLTEKPVLVGHSMGGHLALRYLVEHPEVFERAVVIAPMVRFIGGLLPSLILVALRLMCGLGLGGWYFLRRDYHPDEVVFEGNPLTSDAARFQTKPDCVRQNPRLAQGGPTLQWLVAAAASMAQLRRESGRIRIPVLMFAPEDERVVDGAFGEALVSSLAKGEVVSLADARHEVLFETDAVLAVFWGHCERFLRGPT